MKKLELLRKTHLFLLKQLLLFRFILNKVKNEESCIFIWLNSIVFVYL